LQITFKLKVGARATPIHMDHNLEQSREDLAEEVIFIVFKGKIIPFCPNMNILKINSFRFSHIL